MLNRRHLRVRVLQFYSWNRTKSMDIMALEKQFLKSLEKSKSLYLYLLLLIVEMRDFASPLPR